MMTLAELLEQQQIEDAIVSLLEVHLPIVVGELDFYEGTWKGQPINLKEAGQLSEIVDSLSLNEEGLIKLSALLVNWGRNYEICRLLRTTSLGNLSAATVVYNSDDDAPHGGSTADEERGDNNNN
jgi:sulfur carrier protein ThiS